MMVLLFGWMVGGGTIVCHPLLFWVLEDCEYSTLWGAREYCVCGVLVSTVFVGCYNGNGEHQNPSLTPKLIS